VFDGDTCDECSSGQYNSADDGADCDGDGACDVGDDDDDGNLSSKPDTSPKALERLQKDFVQTIHESADKPMLDDLYTSYKEEISALKDEDQKWFRNEYKKQITFMKEKENKNGRSKYGCKRKKLDYSKVDKTKRNRNFKNRFYYKSFRKMYSLAIANTGKTLDHQKYWLKCFFYFTFIV
jgi:hypothetical protein